MENTEVIQLDLITDEIDPYFQYSHATQRQRLLNLIIDNVLMRLTLTYGTGLVVGKILMAIFPELMFRIFNENGKTGYLMRMARSVYMY